MAQHPEPKHLKEALIECMAEKHDLYDAGFTAPNLSSPAYGFEFDPSALERDEGFSAFAAFDIIDLPSSVTSAERDKRLQGLTQKINSYLLDKKLQDLIMKLVDDELRESGCPGYRWEGKSLANNAYQLSMWRVEKSLSHPPKSVDYNENLKKYEFRVCLLSLHYGYSEIVNQISLCFSYDTPFYDFLDTLRNQTVLCTIPPHDFPLDATSDLARSSSHESSHTLSIHEPHAAVEHIPLDSFNLAKNGDMTVGYTNVPQQDTLKVETSGAKAKRYQGGSKRTNTVENFSIPEVTRHSRSHSEKGYTLNDGPWRYKIAFPGNSCFTDINNEETYIAMLEGLRKVNSPDSPQSKRTLVVIMHSMDRDAWDRWRAHQEDEERETKSLRKRLARSPGADSKENADDEWGELYSKWWLRNAQQGLNRPKTPAKSNNQFNSRLTSLSSNSDPLLPNDKSVSTIRSNSPPKNGKADAFPYRVRSSPDPTLPSPAYPSGQSSQT